MTVSHILEKCFNELLKKYQLQISIEPMFEREEFWGIVNKFSDRITQAEFELVSPNMSNISEKLKIDLREINLETDTQKSHVKLESAKGESLNISPDSPVVNSLVDYASEGGGNISLKVSGIQKKYNTNNTVKSVECEALDLQAETISDAISILKELLT